MSAITRERDAKMADAIEYYHENEANLDRLSIRQIALRFDVNYSTLSLRLRNKTRSRTLISGYNRVFSKA